MAEDQEGDGEMDIIETPGSKLFQDSVHGNMCFEKLLVKVIDTKEFQRLRNIKQLSMTYHVYPSAAHNRFEHCLGVCWLAGQLLNTLEINSSKRWKKIIPCEKEQKKIKLAIQVAALLHDIGHGPFSHTWEVFVKDCGIQWDHETTSCEIIDLMIWKGGVVKKDENFTALGQHFKEAFTDVKGYVEFIKSVILGKPNDKLPKERRFLFQIVANKDNDIDVDKFDYFVRDAQHLRFGVPFDHVRLMILSRIEMENDGTSYIAFRDVEKYSIQSLFQVRADLHVRAYQHRVVKCLETMLIDALKEAVKAEFRVGNYLLSKVQTSPAHFVKLTDSIAEIIMNTEESEFEESRKILNRIVTRRLYDLIGEWVLDVKQTEEEKKENRPPSGLSDKQRSALLELLGDSFTVTQVCVNQGKYYDPISNVKFYSKDGEKTRGKVRKQDTPYISKIELPYYKVYVFKRTEEECDKNDILAKVTTFLRRQGVYKLADDNIPGVVRFAGVVRFEC